MINRRAVVYCELPEALAPGQTQAAKLPISIGMVVPKEMEGKKATEFIDNQMDEVSKEFKKFIKKRVTKLLGE